MEKSFQDQITTKVRRNIKMVFTEVYCTNGLELKNMQSVFRLLPHWTCKNNTSAFKLLTEHMKWRLMLRQMWENMLRQTVHVQVPVIPLKDTVKSTQSIMTWRNFPSFVGHNVISNAPTYGLLIRVRQLQPQNHNHPPAPTEQFQVVRQLVQFIVGQVWLQLCKVDEHLQHKTSTCFTVDLQ